MRPFLLAAAVAATLVLVACSSATRLRVRGVTPLNINDASESVPVDVRIYQLKDDARFRNAKAEEIWVKPKETLADDIVSETKITVFPGRSEDAPRDVELGQLPPEVRFVGILALYSKTDDKGPRHLVLPRAEAHNRVLRFSGYHVTKED